MCRFVTELSNLILSKKGKNSINTAFDLFVRLSPFANTNQWSYDYRYQHYNVWVGSLINSVSTNFYKYYGRTTVVFSILYYFVCRQHKINPWSFSIFVNYLVTFSDQVYISWWGYFDACDNFTAGSWDCLRWFTVWHRNVSVLLLTNFLAPVEWVFANVPYLVRISCFLYRALWR